GGPEEPELLLDLGDVTVTTDAVRLHALVDLAEHEVRLRLAAGAAHPALGIDDEVADESGPGQRGEGEDRRRRIAPRGAHDPRLAPPPLAGPGCPAPPSRIAASSTRWSSGSP